MSYYSSKFENEIVKLSVSDNYEEAILEWTPTHVEFSDSDHECICGKTDIHELCFIKNDINGIETIVGNECIKKFGYDGYDGFFQQLRSLRNNISGNYPIGLDLASQARIDGLVDKNTYVFLKSMHGKQKYSSAQKKWKRDIANKILFVYGITEDRNYF